MTREAHQGRLWAAYCAARDRAAASSRIDDGIAAGRAWAAFIDSFLSKPARDARRDPARPDVLRFSHRKASPC